MKEKILSVSVAAYNVAEFLRNTLDSCAVPSVLEELEVLVVNDGSKDETSAIAHEYEARYPDTFRVVDKENGGYGTTVNASMALARGKYFRLLDGDDWFDPAGLEKLVAFLRTCEADAVLTGRAEVNAEGEQKHSANRWYDLYAESLNNQTRSLETLEPFAYGMWVVTYRTELLRQHPFTLPSHMLYTDSMYVTFMLPYLRSYAFQDYDVYCYRVGHEGQSVSVANRVRHLKDAEDGYAILLDFYRKQESIPEANRNFLNLRMAQYYSFLIRTILLAPPSGKEIRKIRENERRLLEGSRELYDYVGQNNSFLKYCRKFTYQLYWIRKLKKIPNWV